MTELRVIVEDLRDVLIAKDQVMEAHARLLRPYDERIRELEEELTNKMIEDNVKDVTYKEYVFSRNGFMVTRKQSRRRREATQRRAVERVMQGVNQ